MANYPGAATTFTTKNTGDTIQAAHINTIQDEVAAIENALLDGLSHVVKPGTTDTYDLGSSSLRWQDLYLTGVIDSTATGTHSLSGSSPGAVTLRVRNSAAGVANRGVLEVGSDVGSNHGSLEALASTFTSAGVREASGVALIAAGSAGLNLAATHGSGPIKLQTNGGTTRVSISATQQVHTLSYGLFYLQDVSTTSLEAQIRASSGKKGYLSFVEDSVAARWALGCENGDSTLYLRSGDTTGTVQAALGGSGAVSFPNQLKCLVYTSGGQSISSSLLAYTNVAFDAEAIDTGGFHDTVTNNNRLTVPTGGDGIYLLWGQIVWAADGTATGQRSLRIWKNNTTALAWMDARAIATAQTTQILCWASLAAADYVQLSGKQDSGGALSLATGAEYTQFGLVKVG